MLLSFPDIEIENAKYISVAEVSNNRAINRNVYPVTKLSISQSMLCCLLFIQYLVNQYFCRTLTVRMNDTLYLFF